MLCKHLIARVRSFVGLFTCLMPVPALAQSSYFSATGDFTAATGASQRFVLDFADTADTTFRTLAWAGGVNAAGNTIAPNGIDSVLTFTDGVEFSFVNDDLRPGILDSLLSPAGLQGTLIPPLGPASGTLSLSNNPSANGLHWAMDMTRDGEFLLRRPAATNSTVTSFTWGGTSPGIAKLRLGLPGALVTTGPVIGREGSSFELAFGGRLTAGTDFALGGVGTISAGTLSVAGIEYFNGPMLQTGGINSSHKVIVGHAAGEAGTYRLSGGSLNTSFADIGRSGSGTFIQDGGQANFTSNLLLANSPGSSGRYFLNDGTLTVATLEGAFGGSATFIHSGGAANIDTVLIGRGPAGSARYDLGGGTVSTVSTVVGEQGPGTFSHTAGHHSAGGLMLGNGEFGAGTYFLSGGPLTVANDVTVGDLGSGNMIHSGGSAWAMGNIVLAARSGSSGTYTLNGGTLVSNLLKPGASGTGTFIHDAGHVSIGEMVIGEGTTGVGRYALSGTGSISANNIYVGVSGQGTMAQSGGIVNVSGLFTLVGRDAGSSGRYEQSGGFHQTKDLFLGYFPGSSGVYNLSGGQLIAGNANIGNEGAGTFTQSGGEFNPIRMHVGFAPTSTGTYDLGGGTLKVNQRLYVGTTGTVNFTVGKLQAGTLDIRGGARVLLSSGSDKVVRANSLEMYGNGRLDLADNAAIIDYSGESPLPAIHNLLKLGYANGGWNAAGIISSAAAANPGHSLGYAEASSVFTSFPAPFAGEFVDDSSILVRYTRYGDADLSGSVNLADFNRLAANFGSANRLWSDGDFNYDNLVNLADFNLMAANFGLSAGPDGPSPQDWSDLAAAVPEPSAVALALCALLPLCQRRRRQVR